MSNKIYIVETKGEYITDRVNENIQEAIKEEGYIPAEVSKYDILEDYEIYDSGALSYDTRNKGGITRDYKFIKIG